MDATRTLLLSLILILQLRQGCSSNPEMALIQKLLTGYDQDARPVLNSADSVKVEIGMSLYSIIDVDEIGQQIDTKVWLKLYWTDINLRWNSSEEGGIKYLTISPIRIWRPDITLYDDLNQNPTDYNAKLFQATVTSEGKVSWYLPRILSSSCTMDMTYYPWDEQYCYFRFSSWTYDKSGLDLVNQNNQADMDNYGASSEWYVISAKAERNEVMFDCCESPFPDVTYTLRIRRKTVYYTFNLILPAIFIMFTAVLVFYLPPESGEKVGLGMTVLLAMTVFLLMVADSVPISDTVPLMGEYFATTIILMAICSSSTVIILNVHFRGAFGNKVPRVVRIFVLDWMARPLCMKAKVDANISEYIKRGDKHEAENGNVNNGYKHDMEMAAKNGNHGNHKQQTGDTTLLAILEVLQGFQKSKEEADKGGACETDWMLVAAVIDRFLLVVFTIVTLIVTVAILTAHPSYDDPIIA